jgi:hypothetical protein
MSSAPASGSWWAPSWRRLVGSTVVLFVVILAFLVGRVRAGADPGLAREASQTRQQQSAPGLSSPGSTGSTDNFGNAIPGGRGSDSGGFDGGQGSQNVDPPSTHVS